MLSDADRLIKSNADVIVIASPRHKHFEFALKSFNEGKHVWVEKPYTSTTKRAITLIELEERANLKILV